ncbi:MAG: LAGLIDADG family homing endonuclease [Candidatus Micrarchaeota archaeon]
MGDEFQFYLDKLVINRSPGNDSIRAYGIRGMLREHIGGSLKDLARVSGSKYRNILNWLGDMEGDVGIPVGELLRLAKILGIEQRHLQEKNLVFGNMNSKKCVLPRRMNGELAYLLGYIMGDGHLSNPKDFISNGSKYNAEIRITTADESHLKYLQCIFSRHFAYVPPLYREGNFYRLVGRSKTIHRFLSIICGIPTGNKKDKTCIPFSITSSEMHRFFLAGFFDSDGSVVCKNGRIISLRLKQHNRTILEDCQCILKNAGIINPGLYADFGIRKGTKTEAYVIAIQNKRDIERFIKIFPSLKIQERGFGQWKKLRCLPISPSSRTEDSGSLQNR